MPSATLQPLPSFQPPASAGRSTKVAICIVLAHALLAWGWLATKLEVERKTTPLPLLVTLMQPADPIAEPTSALPSPPTPARPALSPLEAPTLVSVAAEAAAPMTADKAPVIDPAPAAAPAPVFVAQPMPPQQIPPSAVQYLEPPKLVYPRASIRNGERGRVTVRVFIDSQGWPQQVEVAVSSGFVRLDEAAVAAVRQARFKPYRVDGVPVAGWALVPADFG